MEPAANAGANFSHASYARGEVIAPWLSQTLGLESVGSTWKRRRYSFATDDNVLRLINW